MIFHLVVLNLKKNNAHERGINFHLHIPNFKFSVRRIIFRGIPLGCLLTSTAIGDATNNWAISDNKEGIGFWGCLIHVWEIECGVCLGT